MGAMTTDAQLNCCKRLAQKVSEGFGKACQRIEKLGASAKRALLPKVRSRVIANGHRVIIGLCA